MAISIETLRAIFADELASSALADPQAEAVKRAMWRTASAERESCAELAKAQTGKRPECICGSCASFIHKTIMESTPK